MTPPKPPALPRGIPQPWMPAPYEDADVYALKNLAAGNANEGQQQRVLKFIIEALCGNYDLSFRPGDDGPRATDFAEGKRFVALQLVKLINMNPKLLKGNPHG